MHWYCTYFAFWFVPVAACSCVDCFLSISFQEAVNLCFCMSYLTWNFALNEIFCVVVVNHYFVWLIDLIDLTLYWLIVRLIFAWLIVLFHRLIEWPIDLSCRNGNVLLCLIKRQVTFHVVEYQPGGCHTLFGTSTFCCCIPHPSKLC